MMQRRIKQIQRWGVLRGWREGDSDRGNPHKGGNAASHLKVLREGTTGKKAAAGELAHAEARNAGLAGGGLEGTEGGSSSGAPYLLEGTQAAGILEEY